MEMKEQGEQEVRKEVKQEYMEQVELKEVKEGVRVIGIQ